MHFGYRNNKSEHHLGTEKLQTTAEDMDLGVIASEDLNVSNSL